jgi:hypothetical protein
MNGNSVTINLTNVSDVQTVSVTMSGVQQGANVGDIVIPVKFLLGDVNGDSAVNSADATVMRNRSGQLTDANNFRADVNVDGTVNSADATIIRSRSGNGIAIADRQ